jgi:propanol-preferring alcohol dehydrogenase
MRRDGEEFLTIAAGVPVKTVTRVFALEQANEAPAQLRAGASRGSGVLVAG